MVKAFTRESKERQSFRTATKDYYHKAMRVVYLDALAGPVIEVLGVARRGPGSSGRGLSGPESGNAPVRHSA